MDGNSIFRKLDILNEMIQDREKRYYIMKNFEKLSDSILSDIWGGNGARPPKLAYIELPDPKGHGKTQPGGNEEIFDRRTNMPW